MFGAMSEFGKKAVHDYLGALKSETLGMLTVDFSEKVEPFKSYQ